VTVAMDGGVAVGCVHVPVRVELSYDSASPWEVVATFVGAGAGGTDVPWSFARDLLEDVIPFIENKFRVLPGRENRALGGLSMGGGQTVAIGFANPDIFSWLVIMSAGATNAPQSYPEFFNAEVTDRMMDLIWVGIGEDDNLTGASARALHEALTEHGIEHVWRLTPGRHEWNVWRHHLREVAPLLFQD